MHRNRESERHLEGADPRDGRAQPRQQLGERALWQERPQQVDVRRPAREGGVVRLANRLEKSEGLEMMLVARLASTPS